MATIVQRLRRLVGPVRPDRALLADAAAPDLSAEQIERLIDRLDAARASGPDRFDLAFTRGALCERLADQLPPDRRASWLARAVGAYEDALMLAGSGRVDGAERIADLEAGSGAPGIASGERAILATCFRLGVLLCADFRVRDPARAAAYLERVARQASGSHPAWYYLGEAHLLGGEFDAAEAAWREGLARAPDDEMLRAVLRNLPADRVRHRMKAKDWRGVLEELGRAPADAMPRAERLAIEGDACRELGDRDRAAALYRAAIQADPRVVDVRRKLKLVESGRAG